MVGRNGVGKTTLLKALLADAPGVDADPSAIDAGQVRWGHEVSVGYFSQDHTGAIAHGTTAVEWLHSFAPDAPRQDIHGLLGQMLFSGEEGHKPTAALSGGETARLLFCRLMLQKPNVLVLDEPTNHLDLEVDQRPQHRAAEVRRHGVPGDARRGPDRRGRHPGVALHAGRHRGLEGHVRGVRRRHPVTPGDSGGHRCGARGGLLSSLVACRLAPQQRQARHAAHRPPRIDRRTGPSSRTPDDHRRRRGGLLRHALTSAPSGRRPAAPRRRSSRRRRGAGRPAPLRPAVLAGHLRRPAACLRGWPAPSASLWLMPAIAAANALAAWDGDLGAATLGPARSRRSRACAMCSGSASAAASAARSSAPPRAFRRCGWRARWQRATTPARGCAGGWAASAACSS